ncbi:emp24p/erv25p- protein [Coelomomyces lativittatus]|nr:emp24p/erv25p- protein [Coelomomyces lativittatus]
MFWNYQDRRRRRLHFIEWRRVMFTWTTFTLISLFFSFLFERMILQVHGLHFYIQHNHPKTFSEELAMGTDVLGSFKTEEWSDTSQSWIQNLGISVQIEVKEQSHRALPIRQLGVAMGNFTFTAPENGIYDISFTTNTTSEAWFNQPRVRFYLDIIIGESASANNQLQLHTAHFSDIADRVQDLVHRATDIRRELQFQREKEAQFRDLSENVNSRIVSWTIVQMCVVAMTCVWQLRHLKTFFTKKKLV